MKPLFLLAAALTLLPALTFAQSNFKPGYVVTLKGDTLRGEINQKEWFGNPKSVEFKSAAGVKTYTVDDIGYFELLNSSIYQRYSGEISMDETNTSKLQTGVDSTQKQDVVFLRVEQNGPNVTLYSYIDAKKTRFFIGDNKTGQIKELVYRIYYLPDHGVQTRIENIFIPQLYDLAIKYNPTSEKLKTEIENSAYNLPDLKSISQKLNNMFVDKKTYGGKSAWKFFAGLGINATLFTTSNSGTSQGYKFYNAKNTTSVYPAVAAGVNLYPNPSVGKLIVRGEVMVTGAAYKNSVDLYFNQPDIPKSDFNVKEFLVIINPQVIYNIYNTANFKFFIDAGMSYAFVKTTGNSIYNSHLQTTIPNYLSLSSGLISFPVKLGITVAKKVDIYISYSTPAAITNSRDYSIDATSIKAGINYEF
ncbi:hypothetical protein [Mucilaginibacter ginsenosidivorax]|uniref:Outer membrane protein beta-barrel domain-containing protein n=1 Tax=Mucilaginibacter ginsenosidivorax TaxID=862126 RepID=A0A5B8W8V9_9SPHI|nr:hypothetical protein [Mucilaginibacter ginsenosidivorax]QEC79406.1 hypothetical protein FSB76_26925 [Mucilaginibacter ginsenosidivorax]